LLSWSKLINRIYPPIAVSPGATNAAPEAQGAMASNAPTASAVPPPMLSPATTSRPALFTNTPEETLVLTNDNARYTFTSRGGGLKLIELLQYPETVSRHRKGQPLTSGVAGLNVRAPVPVLAVLGDESVQGDGVFALTRTAGGVRAEKTLPGGLRLVKEFLPGTNYLVTASVRYSLGPAKNVICFSSDWPGARERDGKTNAV
jgi:hypothetical protein